MALVDPYAQCPCGSGQKFKWCCHKVEAVAERAQRLFESGQVDAAIEAIDAGLKKEPDNAWLLTRKALYLAREGQAEPSKEAIRQVLRKNPKHAGALLLMTRLVLETEGPAAGAAQLQQALAAFPADARASVAGLVRLVGVIMVEAGEIPAAVRHLHLYQAIQGSDKPQGEAEAMVATALKQVESNPGISPWLKNLDELAPAPEALRGEARGRFEEALRLAGEGLWSPAAAAFDLLSSDPVAGPLADRNQGFCRLWLADHVAAVTALRRYAATLGATPEAVDIEALCQQVAPPGAGSLVEVLQLTWPIRDRKALLNALDADPTVYAEGPAAVDPEDPDSPTVEEFCLLDRPRVDRDAPELTVDAIPRIEARVFVGAENVSLEVYDDGRLERLSERFTALAGPGIPPAHPKTKVVAKVPRSSLALSWDWLLPEGLSPERARALNREQGARMIETTWPETPHPALGGRTPRQAAEAGDAQVPLRAAVLQFELGREEWREGFDFAAFRARLNIPPEPVVDPETADVEALHPARLAMIPVDRLSDEKLGIVYRRARKAAMVDVLARTARVLVERPEALERLGIESLTVYTDLAAGAATAGRPDEARDWVRRGRQADPPAKRARHAPAWDMLELRLSMRDRKPEEWVPELAVILERYGPDPAATQTVMLNLVDLGLLEMVSHPDRPGEVLLDSRPLQALLAEYGPRVTTAGGQLGVSATRPEIWTPGSAGGQAGGGGIWTPGSSTPQEGGGKSLIIPGR